MEKVDFIPCTIVLHNNTTLVGEIVANTRKRPGIPVVVAGAKRRRIYKRNDYAKLEINIPELRDDLGALTQGEFANLIGVSTRTVEGWERKSNPRRPDVRQFIILLETEWDEFSLTSL